MGKKYPKELDIERKIGYKVTMLNGLWRPTNEPDNQPKQAVKPKKTHYDDICETCPNKSDNHCRGLCPPLKWINGRHETAEIIPDKPVKYGVEQLDYNTYLHELISSAQATDADKIDTIRSISNYRVRAIAACILAYIPQQQIAKFAHISQGRISKLYRAVKR